MVATFCQYEALKYVSFPVQTLGKCAKMIPVMIWGSAVNGKTYKAKDYIVALLVTAGCAMFAMTGALPALLSHAPPLCAIASWRFCCPQLRTRPSHRFRGSTLAHDGGRVTCVCARRRGVEQGGKGGQLIAFWHRAHDGLPRL